jgi:DNA-binding transcriptional ArsR family regulator
MQLLERQARAPQTAISIGPSLAVELSWVLLAAGREQLCLDHPALQALYSGGKGLQERVNSFWDDGVADFGEQLVLADQAGLVASIDIGELLTGIAAAAVHSPSELTLASEEESDRVVFLQRLDQLRHSSRLRRDYVRLLAELWSEVDGMWRETGRQVVEVACSRLKRRVEQGANWRDVVVSDSEHLSSLLPGLIDKVAPVASVTIVPSWFSGQGLLFDLPSGILVGLRAAVADAGTRARTDLVARRLKALADPTRLAIAYSLGGGSMTVGEIAKSFDLAQPTVSNHMKILRDAGIVRGERHGNRLELEVRPEAAMELLDELKALLNHSGEGAEGTFASP